MNKKWLLIYIFYILLLLNNRSYGQDKTIEIIGFVKDNINNKFINKINVRLLNKNDSSTYMISVSREDGYFKLRGIPNKNFIISFSHILYETISFELPKPKNNIINLDTLNFLQKTNQIKEVIIKPPIYYNKDTLEINSDSFKLDSSAVVSDLLRKIPELVIWGNGSITYKGKKIESFTLNGKKFLSGDANILINNIPKTATSQIQIFNRNQNIESQDSTYQMNIKTKSEKINYFGIISNIISTRYDSSIGLTMFNKRRIQASIYFNANNVNKSISGNHEFLENTTYKETSKIQSSNIIKLGNNKLLVYGINSKYSFTDKPDNIELNQILASFNSLKQINRNNSKYKTENNSINFVQNSIYSDNQINKIDNFDFKYEKKNERFYVNNSFNYQNINLENINQSSFNYQIENVDHINSSQNNIIEQNKQLENNLSFNYRLPKKGILLNTNIDVTSSSGTIQGVNFLNESLIEKQRESTSKKENNQANINIKLSNIYLYRRLKLKLSIESKSYLSSINSNSFFVDNGIFNDRLSNKRNHKVFSEHLSNALNYSKYSNLTNRFEKSLLVNLGYDFSYFRQTQTSNNNLLNDKLVTAIIFPRFNFLYEKSISQKTKRSFEIKVYGNALLPEIERRVNVEDEFNPLNILQGNKDLISEKRYIGNIKYSIEKSFYDHYVSFDYILIDDPFVYNTSIEDSKYIYVSYNNFHDFACRTTFQLFGRKKIPNQNQNLTIALHGIWNFNNTPIMSDKEVVSSEVHNINLNSNVGIEILHNFLFSFSSSLSKYYISRSINSNLTSYSQDSNIQFRIKNSMRISLSWLYSLNSSNNTNITTKNSILNFEVSYRTLKGKNLEFSFNIWDIFNNNKELLNTFDGVYFTTGEVNRIRQYATFGAKYYIRKFD